MLAAGAAAFVAYRLGRGQIAIAETQADIARRNWETSNEKIVLELFDRRLAIFDEVRDVVGEVTRTGQALDKVLFRFDQACDRAPYFFGSEVQEYLARPIRESAAFGPD